jgi:hypothetical protein
MPADLAPRLALLSGRSCARCRVLTMRVLRVRDYPVESQSPCVCPRRSFPQASAREGSRPLASNYTFSVLECTGAGSLANGVEPADNEAHRGGGGGRGAVPHHQQSYDVESRLGAAWRPRTRQCHRRGRGRMVIENKHSTDVESPPPTPRV